MNAENYKFIKNRKVYHYALCFFFLLLFLNVYFSYKTYNELCLFMFFPLILLGIVCYKLSDQLSYHVPSPFERQIMEASSHMRSFLSYLKETAILDISSLQKMKIFHSKTNELLHKMLENLEFSSLDINVANAHLFSKKISLLPRIVKLYRYYPSFLSFFLNHKKFQTEKHIFIENKHLYLSTSSINELQRSVLYEKTYLSLKRLDKEIEDLVDKINEILDLYVSIFVLKEKVDKKQSLSRSDIALLKTFLSSPFKGTFYSKFL